VKDLQTAAFGLVLVFVDLGSGGWDWVPDPIGWILVLLALAQLKEVLPSYRGLSTVAWVCLAVSVITYPPTSVATIDDGFQWLFTLPTLAFCFLLCDALEELTAEGLAFRLRLVRDAFVVVALLPLLQLWWGWDWMLWPARVITWVVEAGLVLAMWDAADEEPAELGQEAGTED
jgi:hypothetical protein